MECGLFVVMSSLVVASSRKNKGSEELEITVGMND